MTRTSKMTLLAVAIFAAQASMSEASPFTRSTGGMGCTVEQVTDSDNPEYQVQGVSRDGKWLAYSEEWTEAGTGNTAKNVFLLDLATGQKKKLKDTVANSGAFSPDGRYLVGAFGIGEEHTDIYEVDLETQKVSPIAPHEQWDWLPSYSPDGSTIVFNSYRVEGQSQVFLFDRETGALRQMTDFPGYDAHAEFSPDGTKILFHRMLARKEEGGYDFELFVIDIESGEERQITPGSDFEESYGSWAPDGKHVVFSSDINGEPEKHNLYVLGPGGETIWRLTKGDWKDSYAYWTRDGKFIYFNSDRGGTANIYRIPMEGLNCRKP